MPFAGEETKDPGGRQARELGQGRSRSLDSLLQKDTDSFNQDSGMVGNEF